MFDKFATKVSDLTGTSKAFLLAFATIVVWAITGPIFNFSDTWQLVINTGTTIVTFLMVFLIQNTQNRDTKEIKEGVAELRAEVRELVRVEPKISNSVIEGDEDGE
jgi:low affinity Fe/Cu permease